MTLTALALLACGCMSLRPVEEPAATIQQQIVSEELEPISKSRNGS
jgi:hypothetical protein